MRIGRPRKVRGLPEAQRGPAFSTLVGLLLLAAEGGEGSDDIAVPTKRRRRGGLMDRLMAALKGA